MQFDFPYKHAYDYLNAIDILDTGSELDIENARKEFRRLYLESYQKKYDQKHARITLCFTKEQKLELQELAKSSNKKTATLLKEIIVKNLNNDYVSISMADEKCRQIEILISLCFDIVEELVFEYPQFETNLSELMVNLKKMEQIISL